MPSPARHRIVDARVRRTPRPFRGFAVRSEEPAHAWDARAPYGRVHLVATDFLDATSLAALAAHGRARAPRPSFDDVTYANVTLSELGTVAPAVPDLPGRIADALLETGVFADAAAACRASVASRIDYLATCGAGFHNDVAGHWPRCLFWILALDAVDVEFVMPHADVRVAIAPGDLVLFDPTMAHGLCRRADEGQAIAESFSRDDGGQVFLTGEVPLADAQWAALGAPWLPVEHHAERGALDLMVAEFDERTGAVKRPAMLRDCMSRSVSYVA